MILNFIIALFAIIFVICFIVKRVLKVKQNGLASLCSNDCSKCSQKCINLKEKLK